MFKNNNNNNNIFFKNDNVPHQVTFHGALEQRLRV